MINVQLHLLSSPGLGIEANEWSQSSGHLTNAVVINFPIRFANQV